MATSPGFVNMGLELNAHYLNTWADHIGRFILNFGAIELFSYQQLMLLEASEEDFLRNIDNVLARRIDRVVTLLSSTTLLSEDRRREAIGWWEEARAGLRWRNRIAHNPVLPTWKPGSNADVDPPDVLGIPDFRQYRDGRVSDSLPMELLAKMIDDSAALGQRLHTVSLWLRGVA